MEEDLGIATPAMLRLMIRMFRHGRPSGYNSMPFVHRLQTDTLLFMVEPVSLVLFCTLVAITLVCVALGIPMHGGASVAASNIGGTLLAFSTVFMVRRVKSETAKPWVLGAVLFLNCAGAVATFAATIGACLGTLWSVMP